VCHNIYPTSFRQSRETRVPTVDLVSDPPTQLYLSSLGAEASSESTASVMLDLLNGTVFDTTSIQLVILVFSSAASKLNYVVQHTLHMIRKQCYTNDFIIINTRKQKLSEELLNTYRIDSCD